MKFLICEATKDQINNGGGFDLFKGQDGKRYFYEVDFDGETVRIEDSISRGLPIGVEDLGSFVFILNRINNYVKSKETLNDFLFEKLIQGAST